MENFSVGKGTKDRARKFSNTQDYQENCFVSVIVSLCKG